MKVFHNSTVDGRFRIERMLGSGGMGVVYLAEQLTLNRSVALKMLNGPLVSDQQAIARFEREAQTLSQLQHKNVSAFYGFGVSEDGSPYIAMEYLQGQTLDKEISREGRLKCRRALEILQQIAEALKHAHSHGIIHRDLKPDNVFLAQGMVKVTDFGLARIFSENDEQKLTKTGYAVGTPIYMSPEQLAGIAVGASTDVYAAGCLFYECLFGHPPYVAQSANEVAVMHAMEPIPVSRPKNRKAILFTGICMLLEQMLVKDWEKRKLTMEEIVLACAHLLSTAEEGDQYMPVSCGKAARVNRSKARLKVSVLFATVIAVGVGFYWYSLTNLQDNEAKRGSPPTSDERNYIVTSNNPLYYMSLAQARMRSRKDDLETVALLEKAESLLQTKGGQQDRILVHLLMGDELRLLKPARHQECLRHARIALKLAQRNPYNDGYSAALDGISRSLYELDRIKEAIDVLEKEALPYERNGQNFARCALEAARLTTCYKMEHRFQKAIDNAKEYLSLYADQDVSPASLDSMYFDIAESYYNLKRYHEAAQYFCKMNTHSEVSSMETGEAFQLSGQDAKAMHWYRRAAKAAGDPQVDAYAMICFGKICQRQKLFARSIDVLEGALRSGEKYPLNACVGKYYLAQAYIHTHMHQAEAVKLLQEVISDPHANDYHHWAQTDLGKILVGH